MLGCRYALDDQTVRKEVYGPGIGMTRTVRYSSMVYASLGSQRGLVIFHGLHLVSSPNGELVDEPLRLAAAVGTKVGNDNRTTGRQQ